MRIGGENRPSWIQRKHWERFGESVEIKTSLVLKTLQDMSSSILQAVQVLSIEFNKTYVTGTIIEKILTVIEKKAKGV